MTKSQLFLEAHRLTRSVIVPGISYRATFAIALCELNGAKRPMNDGYEIDGEHVATKLKDGRTSFFEGKILVDGVGPVDVKLRISKTELDGGATIAVEGGRLVVGGICRRHVETMIGNHQARARQRASEADEASRIASEQAASTAHLPPITGREDMIERATRVRSECYAMVVEGLSENGRMARRDPEVIPLLATARHMIDTNTDAEFWLYARNWTVGGMPVGLMRHVEKRHGS